MILVLSDLQNFVLQHKICSIMMNMSSVNTGKMCILVLSRVLKYMSIISCWLIVVYISSISLLMFCLVVLIITESRIFKSPAIIMDSVSLFSSIRFCFMHFEALLFGAYTFRVVTPSQSIDCFMIMSHSCLSYFTLLLSLLYLILIQSLLPF